MLRLKVTKTSLYRLVSEYEKLPPMCRTSFTKAPRQPDYWLEWWGSAGWCCRAHLASGAGRAFLCITRKEFCGPKTSRVAYSFSLDELRARGMVEEYTTAAERRRAESRTGT